MRNAIPGVLLAALSAACAGVAEGGTIYSFTGTGADSGFGAKADFELDGITLTIKLTNTGTGDITDNGQTLGGMFFSVANAPTFTKVSASLPSGSSFAYVSDPSKVNLSAQWYYTNSLGGKVTGYNEGVSSVGFNVFGAADNFTNQSPKGSDGIDYGLLSTGDDTATGSNGFKKKPWIKDSILLTFTVSSAFKLSDLGDTVRFQYGSDLTETSFTGHEDPTPLTAVPEPSSMVLASAGGLIVLGAWLRRRRALLAVA